MNRIQFIITLFFVLCLTSCKQKENGEINFEESELAENYPNKLYPDTANLVTEAEFCPLYIGEIKKDVKFSTDFDKVVRKTENWKKYKFPKYNSLEIFIDTSRSIGARKGIYEKPSVKLAYPVFVKNITTDTLNVGYAEFLPLIIQAKDRKGHWRSIQKPFRFDCGTGISNFYCAPNKIVITAMKKFTGNFKTKLRLSYPSADSPIYSNEIEGEINESQFNKYKI